MKKKLIMIIPSVAATLAAVALVIHARTTSLGHDSELNASLGGGASLEEGPVPTVNSYDLSAHQTLSRVILLIRENYVEPERIHPYEMFIAALDYIQKTVPEVLVDDSRAPEQIKVSVGSAQQTFELGGVDQLWEVTMSLRDIFRFLQTQLTDPEQRRDIEYAAINGMLSTLDPHSVLLKPESFDEVKLSTKGEFGGLGIVISIRDGALTVISPIEGTPAARAGIKPKDKITKIGEESTVSMSLEEAVQRLRGKPGTKINIWVVRKGWAEARRYTLQRANIKIESVSSQLLADGIGYVKIKSFQNNTYDDLHDQLERLRKKNKGELRGLVLDLRNNPGGLLDQAILVSDRFLDNGPIVITVSEGNRKREEKDAHFSGTERDYPIAVLVNGGSASASEIVSGALKNHDRAVIIGQQTFGKGSVQVLYDFKDKSALKLTIAQYLTPGDLSIQGVGIAPDIQVMPATLSKDAVHLFVDDDSPHEKDLEKHLDRRSGDTELEGDVSVPSTKIVHLVSDSDPGRASPGEESNDTADKFDYDFETRLAHDVLAQAAASDRKTLIASAKTLLAARAKEEEQHIVERLKQLGVDWSEPAAAETQAVEATGQKGDREGQVDLSFAIKPKSTVRAGDSVTLTATARNFGSVPVYRVYGVSNSENPLLKHLEFPFGRILPGASRSWSVDVKLPEDMMARADSVSVSLADEPGRLKPVESTALVAIEEQPKPRFAYRLQLDDRLHGNGDGVLQAGEKVDLNVQVSNLGEGEAKDTLVTLKNLTGEPVFLDRGRDKLGALKPGATKNASLRFSVRDDAQLDAVELKLNIWDNALGGTVSESFKLPVLPARRLETDNKMLKVSAKDEIPIYAGAATSTRIIGYAKPGALIKSDARLEGVWRRIEVPPAVTGFVRDPDVKWAKSPLRPTAKTAVRLLGPVSAPAIDLPLPSLTTSDDVVRLRGSVRDARSLKDVFIFVNDKKLYFRSLSALKPRGDVVSAPLDVTLPLKKGSNAITVVAREDEDLMSRKVFGIFRGAGAIMADAKSATLPESGPQ